MKIYKYKDYDEYVEVQKYANKRKITNSYVDKNSLFGVIRYIHDDLKMSPELVLCHGTRRGDEQKYFIEGFNIFDLKPEVIGTEISDNAGQFPNTIEWDFHIAKEEWINNTDIIYTNSFDHSPKPEECLDIWMGCLKENGACIIEYSDICDSKSGRIDCFGATLDEYKEFITEKYDIVDILTNEGIPDVGFSHKGDRWYIVIKNRK